MSHPLTIALEAAFDPYFLVNGRGEILWQNRSATDLFGLRGIPVRTLRDAFGEESAVKILGTDRGQSLEVRSTKADLAEIPFACFAIDTGSGDPSAPLLLLSCMSLVPDSTKMIQHEEYLAAVAHDLKNPLGALFSYADALLDTTLGTGLSVKQREIIERIRSTAVRSLELVKNFQQLVQIDHRGGQSSASVVELNTIVKATIESLWRGTSTQTLTMELHPKDLSVRVDRFQLERVISNLLTNALKYTPASGAIKVTTSLHDGRPLLRVHNTGSVIPANELGTIFKRYTRASTGTGTPGTGLGLYIVKSILDAASATIDVRSTIHDGTTFTVIFFR